MVDFWIVTWCDLGPLINLVPLDMEKPHFLVAEFFGQEGWNVYGERRWLPSHLVELIIEIPFNPQGKDQIVWASSVTRVFSLSSAWELCRQRRGCFPIIIKWYRITVFH